MKTKLIIFDMDDVMWPLNEKVARITGIPFEKFTHYGAFENPKLTEDEKRRVVQAYTKADTYKDIEFSRPVVDMINRIHREHPECAVHIISNCSNQGVSDAKLPQLLDVLELPKYKIHLHVIDIMTQTKKKTLPEDMFMLVDDSPHNIILGNAVHRIMPARLHNDVLVDGMLGGYKINRPRTDEELVRTVMGYIGTEI